MVVVSMQFRSMLMVLLVLLMAPECRGAENWFKGALHCHTKVSDGDSTPEQVIAWHRAHGYHFLVLTDHNRYTDVHGSGMRFRYPDFLVIPGEEVGETLVKKEIHINAINSRRLVKPRMEKTHAETLKKRVQAARDAGGLPQVNHPFCKNSLTEDEIAAAEGFFLMEIHNAMVSTGPEHETLWDHLLMMGRKVYGTASDDSHYYKPRKGKFALWGRAGNAWVVVRAPSLKTDDILAALEAGDFYATDGIALSRLSVTDRDYTVEVVPEEGTTYNIIFKSGNGRILQNTEGPKACYRYSGKELYVRARIESSKGRMAVTQPRFFKEWYRIGK